MFSTQKKRLMCFILNVKKQSSARGIIMVLQQYCSDSGGYAKTKSLRDYNWLPLWFIAHCSAKPNLKFVVSAVP